jgi:glutamate synthase (NADPH/NADH) large chain
LSNADDIQIKMAQGAKPGEGGQLPGHKVDKYIASIRHSTPGVGLISPPPHHDIYSIEDLAQLIFDLKNVNPKARISVKLVSEFGVGTVAAGVSKAFADHVTISGHDGGTGASPLTSVLSAGGPWELGLAETHQTLLINDLRGRIAVQVDGGLRTGRDVVIGALLGADEFGFATSALIAEGCIMMRKCHLNTCPVGVATQDPELRKHFTGKPEHIVNFFTFLASEVREIMADLGFKNFNDMIGQRDYLDFDEANKHWKANNLDLSNLITQINVNSKNSIFNSEKQKHKISKVLDKKIISKTKPSIDKCEKSNLKLNILNTDRSVGAMLSGIIAKKFGHKGLPKNTINIKFKGSAGQSFGAWLAHGINFSLEGDANDYVGKGLSGGSISIFPSLKSSLIANENIIVGNTVLYGAISGECFINGIAGERFAVRNSGATSVVEGCGDHGCEYMTGGSVVILGNTGRNFAAGMSGGIAYIYDKDNNFRNNCNMGMVSLEKILVNQENQKISEKQLKYEMLDFDEQRLKILISKHVKKTNSIIGKSIIKNWSISLDKFIKVVPNDFKKVLKDQQNNKRKKVLKKVSGF